jgi:hypothetical protein
VGPILEEAPEALKQQNALPCTKPPPCVTSMSQAAPRRDRIAARVSARHSISALNLTASLTEAARLAKKAQICLLIVENVQEHPPFDLQAMQTFKPCRPSKQH